MAAVEALHLAVFGALPAADAPIEAPRVPVRVVQLNTGVQVTSDVVLIARGPSKNHDYDGFARYLRDLVPMLLPTSVLMVVYVHESVVNDVEWATVQGLLDTCVHLQLPCFLTKDDASATELREMIYHHCCVAHEPQGFVSSIMSLLCPVPRWSAGTEVY